MAKQTIAASRSFVGLLFKKLALEIGAKVTLEPTWKTVGQITFKNGKRRYFRYSSVDLNTLGASEISKDKDYAAFFMQKMGYKAVQGEAYYSDGWCKAIDSKRNTEAALKYAKRAGFPLFVKPNDGSQGRNVSKVRSELELLRALREIFKSTDIALIQKPVPGRDYRIVVLDGKVISAYERIPLSVVGDGKKSIRELLVLKQKDFDATGRDTQIKLDDPRIVSKLASQDMTFRSTPANDQQVFLLDNANLSAGGDAVDVTDVIHTGFKKLAINVARDMNLRICGVDLMTPDISKAPKQYTILETNAAPGLDHYVKSGPAQKKIVEDLYRAVLKAMSR